jgi:hypothetical protein
MMARMKELEEENRRLKKMYWIWPNFQTTTTSERC